LSSVGIPWINNLKERPTNLTPAKLSRLSVAELQSIRRIRTFNPKQSATRQQPIARIKLEE